MRLLAVWALVLAACSDDDSIEPGLLAPEGMVEAPASVMVGRSFVVTVRTFGDGCVRFERTDVESHGDGAEIWALDRFHHVTGDEACSHLLNHFTHDTTLTFFSSGTKTIVVHGSIQRAGGGRDDYPWPLTVVVE